MNSYPIVPTNNEKGIPKLIKLGFIYAIFPILSIALFVGKIIDFSAFFVIFIIFSIIVSFILSISLPMYRISQSRIVFDDEKAIIYDHRNKIWRTILYSNVSRIEIRVLEGFMHGYHGVDGRSKYFVFFFNDSPFVQAHSFYSYFTSLDCFPVFYQEELYSEICSRLPGKTAGQGDGSVS